MADAVNILLHTTKVYKRNAEETCGALWDIFRKEDVKKLKKYPLGHSKEFRYQCGCIVDKMKEMAKSPLGKNLLRNFSVNFPLSCDGKDEMLEEVDNWSLDTIEFKSRVNSIRNSVFSEVTIIIDVTSRGSANDRILIE
nr:lysine-specific demethylase JMJ25-like [Tanacetum cinerariifolium]